MIVGKSVPSERPAKCFGMVQIYDDKPKRRLFDVLSSQGMQMNQDIIFMSDGEKAVRELQLYLNPRAKHMLDWFHITMRITVLQQQTKSLQGEANPAKEAAGLSKRIDSVKHFCYGTATSPRRWIGWATCCWTWG